MQLTMSLGNVDLRLELRLLHVQQNSSFPGFTITIRNFTNILYASLAKNKTEISIYQNTKYDCSDVTQIYGNRGVRPEGRGQQNLLF